MSKYRYVITGGDNGYCARCGGLGDRMLLRIDDKTKTYKAYYFAPSCMGRYCWRSQELHGGGVITRGQIIDGHKLVYNFLQPSKNRVYIIMPNGTDADFIPVTVKGNKYGKDGEFGDRLDHYKFEGYIEPEKEIKEAQETARELMEDMYKRIAQCNHNHK